MFFLKTTAEDIAVLSTTLSLCDAHVQFSF